jgi:adenylate kinase family enzyme
LKVFFAQTAPLIDYYVKAGKLLEINGEGDMEEIKQRILSAIGR